MPGPRDLNVSTLVYQNLRLFREIKPMFRAGTNSAFIPLTG